MTDNVAVLAGFTEQWQAESDDSSLTLDVLVEPDADFEGIVKAWDMDQQEYVRVKGWMFTWTRQGEEV